MSIKAVIGNAFGDEGKGLVTDWLSGDHSITVRFNGGAQAGHTVVTPEGVRHVFHHFGSGTLRGAETYLSRFFACDPVSFVKERDELVKKGVEPVVAVDPMCPVVTPYDVLVNQITEKFRNKSRHGSCGCGFGETMRRQEETPYKLVVADLDSPFLAYKLEAIRIAARNELANRGVFGGIDVAAADRDFDKCYAMFMAHVPDFLENVRLENFEQIRQLPLVFEGAQGLLLDREMGVFPYVTRSKTGLVNVHKLLGDEDFARVNVYFVSRCYMTRHGAGPMRDEQRSGPEDWTNVKNPWQGTLRFGAYDPKLLEWARNYALAEVPSLNRPPKIVTTCLDQMEDLIPVVGGVEMKKSDIVRASDCISVGPTRDDIRWMEK